MKGSMTRLVKKHRCCCFSLPFVLDVDGAEGGETFGHAGARHGRERGAAEHEVGAVGPGAVRDHHPGARRGAELLVLAPHLRAVGARRGETNQGDTHSTAQHSTGATDWESRARSAPAWLVI